MSELYPLKFESILKEKIWGGTSLVTHYNKKADPELKYGESWEISALSGNISVVSNGFLAGNNLEELIEVYMGDITGDSIYDRFGVEFPLLIKLIEAKEDLSIQVHPGNKQAREKHKAYGKTEMWYILENEKNSRIYTGFREACSREEFVAALDSGKPAELLNVEYTDPGDVFFTPAGRIHAIGAGNVLVEIQQTSDITYRIFDWNRHGFDGKPRELHTDLALDAIDFNAAGKNKISGIPSENKTENLVDCEFFTTNIINFNELISKDYFLIDSFVIFICTEGAFRILRDNQSESVIKGETVLLPAMINDIALEPSPEATILEVFIKGDVKNQNIIN